MIPIGSISYASFTGLFVQRWSTPIDNVEPADWLTALDGIQSILRGVPQPRVAGTVEEHEWNRNGRFSYNPDSIRPLSGIVVVAEDKSGKQFRTETDDLGHFQFDSLPAGANPPKYHG